MKTFLGDMHDYIYESRDVGMQVLNNRKSITKNFVSMYQAHKPSQIIITGAGTSNYSAQVVRYFFEKHLGITVLVPLATQIIEGMHLIDDKTMVIGISATGSSASTIKALDYAKSKKAITISLTNELDSEIVKHADEVVWLDHGIEDVSPKSKSVICELVTLYICALEVAIANNTISKQIYEENIKRLASTVDNLTNIAKTTDDWFKENGTDFKACKRLMVLGHNQNLGIIQEAALKILECGRFQTAWYETEEFMHGIYHSIDQDTYFIYLGSKGIALDRMLSLKDYFEDITSRQYLISNMPSSKSQKDLNIYFVDDEDYYPMEYLVPCQVLAYNLAMQRGINPNKPSDPLFHRLMNSKFI